MFKKILVPVDGSATSWKALETAEKLAQTFKGELLVIHVVQTYNSAELYVNGLEAGTLSAENNQITTIGSRILETAKTKLEGFPGKVDFALEIGHPADRIVDVAKEKGVTDIVIGSRGLSGIAEFFLGSVSSKVSQYATVPVLIVK